MADASKLGRRAFARICSPSEITTLVTDTNADPDLVAQFRAVGVEVLLV